MQRMSLQSCYCHFLLDTHEFTTTKTQVELWKYEVLPDSGDIM